MAPSVARAARSRGETGFRVTLDIRRSVRLTDFHARYFATELTVLSFRRSNRHNDRRRLDIELGRRIAVPF